MVQLGLARLAGCNDSYHVGAVYLPGVHNPRSLVELSSSELSQFKYGFGRPSSHHQS
jgi:hypothetical protein